MDTNIADAALRAGGRNMTALLRHTTKWTADPDHERVLMISFLKEGVVSHVPIIYKVYGTRSYNCDIGRVRNDGIVERDPAYAADNWVRPNGSRFDALSSDIAKDLFRDGRIDSILSEISGVNNSDFTIPFQGR